MLEPASFPSLLVTADRLAAQGSFAQSQLAVLDPDRETVVDLTRLLERTQTGIVAHYYMAPELQGVLLATSWPHVHISDSLVMADRAVQMARAGAKAILVLGVDFMSENVRALLDASGYAHVPVWRAAQATISCSLAEAAETPAYLSYLERAARTPHSIHVVYINTSLSTKAHAESRLATITCTSSNVVSMVLQCFAQVPGCHVWFGPDTYMGQNVACLLQSLVELGDDAVRAVHPQLSAAQLSAQIPHFHYFEAGNCIVHHLFGDQVASQIERDYGNTLLTAHLEVPGHMFRLALHAQQQGRGVVGSTADILRFVAARVHGALNEVSPAVLRIVLGTEVGLLSSLLHQTRAQLRASGAPALGVEIIFPVASDAITVTSDKQLPVVPGVTSGEGCSLEGGCATCPYMKMNHIDAVFEVLNQSTQVPSGAVTGFAARRHGGNIDGESTVQLATRPILAMRHFSQHRQLPDSLVARMLVHA